MYSGNHSPCHPLDTLLDAARKLETRPDVVFCFVGGGSEQAKVRASALSNVKCLPYQPLDELSHSLSAADLHVVVMGEKFVGIVHPCKVYNILAVGAPVLYIGPEPSHVTDIASQHGRFLRAQPGDVDGVVAAILAVMRKPSRKPAAYFSKQNLLAELIALIELGQDLQDFSGLQDRFPVRPSPGR
jgi:hypothetical protein